MTARKRNEPALDTQVPRNAFVRLISSTEKGTMAHDSQT